MAWGIVAVAGVNLVSSVMASDSASKSAKKARKQRNKQLSFEQQRYSDWNAVYGGLQDNLSEYYSGITPEYYASIGLENFEKQFQTGITRMEESLAQRGIDPSSGLSASLMAQAELGAAEERASIRRDAPRLAAEDQREFLQIGLGQDPASSVSSALAAQANSTATDSRADSKAAGDAAAAAIPAIGQAITAYNKG